MKRNLTRGTAFCLSLLLAGEPGAAVFVPAALPPGAAHLPPAPAVVTAPPPPPAPAAEERAGAAPRTLAVEPVALPEAPAAEALPVPAPEPEAEEPAPSALPKDARAPRKERLTGGRLKVTAGVTAELLKDEGARDGFRMMRVTDSEGFMLEYASAPRPEAVDPLIIDLDGDGVRTRGRRVAFDIDGDGKRDSVNDIYDGDGRAGEDGGELLGDAARFEGRSGGKLPDGFAALETLAALAAADGLLSPEVGLRNSLDREDLEALEDSWGLRVRLGGLKGRDRRLSELGVVRLDLAAGPGQRHEDYDGRGNALTAAEGAQVVLADGTRRAYGELWLRKKTGTLTPVAR